MSPRKQRKRTRKKEEGTERGNPLLAVIQAVAVVQEAAAVVAAQVGQVAVQAVAHGHPHHLHQAAPVTHPVLPGLS